MHGKRYSDDIIIIVKTYKGEIDMRYSIEGGNLPVVKISLEAGETITCEAGSMAWRDQGIEMKTEGGGLGKMFSRLLSSESMFLNHYTANTAGEIAFASKFPGNILAIEVTPDKPVIVLKGSYLAYFGNVERETFFQKKFSTGFFGGEGFIMSKFSGTGMLFVEIDGTAFEYELAAGERKVINTGYMAVMDATCDMDIESIKGAKNIFFGGEGFFNTVITGPGKLITQSMPIGVTAMRLYDLMPHPSSSD